MREFNETPYQVLHRDVMYEPGQPFMSVVVKGMFKLVEGGPSKALPAERHLPVSNYENYLDKHGNSFKIPMETSPFKLRGEWLFIGAAHAPGGKPVPNLDVSVQIGSYAKTLTIFGDRSWVRDDSGSAHLSEPEPFTEMPIRAEYAHGGIKSKYNQHGIGFGVLGDAAGASIPAANVMPSGQVGVSWERDGVPAGFGMLAPNLLPRRAMLGTYDETWRVRRMPLPPADFNPAFFNAAPEDQQFDGYFRGDEQVVLRNLHPDIPEFKTALPGTRVRCFVNRQTDIDEPRSMTIAEVITVLDTVVIDMLANTLTLQWRGTLEIEDRFHQEIKHVLFIEEPLDKSQSSDFYAAMLQDKLVDKQALAREAEMEERKKRVAEIDAEGRANVLKSLKDGGAPPELIAEVEKQGSVDAAQAVMLDWVKKNFGHLIKPES